MQAMYQTQATANAGRNGTVATDDGKLRLSLSYPKEMGGSGESTNPERLVKTAHQVCPYSNAVRGNIDVALTVNERLI